MMISRGGGHSTMASNNYAISVRKREMNERTNEPRVGESPFPLPLHLFRTKTSGSLEEHLPFLCNQTPRPVRQTWTLHPPLPLPPFRIPNDLPKVGTCLFPAVVQVMARDAHHLLRRSHIRLLVNSVAELDIRKAKVGERTGSCS